MNVEGRNLMFIYSRYQMGDESHENSKIQEKKVCLPENTRLLRLEVLIGH